MQRINIVLKIFPPLGMHIIEFLGNTFEYLLRGNSYKEKIGRRER